MNSYQALYQLKIWRKQKAKEEKVFPFMIFSDKILTQLINSNPKTYEDFLKLRGVSKVKIEKYYQEILQILQQKQESTYKSLYNNLKQLLSQEQFVSKKDFINLIDQFKNETRFILNNINITKNELYENVKVELEEFEYISAILRNPNENITKHNQEFIENKLISEKTYLDDILRPIDKKISLDENQRRVVFSRPYT